MTAGASARAFVATVAVTVAAGCAAPTVASPLPETERVGGPGWSIELPTELGLAPGPVPATELTGTWEAREGEGVRQVTVLVNRETAAPLDDYFDRVELAPGARVEREAPVQMPSGRATWFRIANVDAPSHDLVLVEPRPGIIVSLGGTGIGADALVAIARTLVVEDR